MQGRGNDIKEAIRRKKAEKSKGETLSENLNKIKEKFKVTEDNKRRIVESADEAFKDYVEKYEESAKVVDPGIIPIGMNVLMTATLMSIDETGYFLTRNNFSIEAIDNVSKSLSDTQRVISTGPSCQQVKVGDKIVFDRAAFVRMSNPNSVNAKEVDDIDKAIIYIKDRPYLLMHERDIKYIVKDE